MKYTVIAAILFIAFQASSGCSLLSNAAQTIVNTTAIHDTIGM